MKEAEKKTQRDLALAADFVHDLKEVHIALDAIRSLRLPNLLSDGARGNLESLQEILEKGYVQQT